MSAGHVARSPPAPSASPTRAASSTMMPPYAATRSAVEGRLEHAPLAQVEVALAGEQPVAEHDLRRARTPGPS